MNKYAKKEESIDEDQNRSIKIKDKKLGAEDCE